MGTSAKATLELGARHAEVVQFAIQHWVEREVITQSQASTLTDTVAVRGFDWEKFAKYTLRLAVLCLFVAVIHVVFEDRFVRLLKRIKILPPWLRAAATAVVAVGMHVFAHRRSQHVPAQKYVNEGFHGVGALLFALAALQVLKQLNDSFKHSTETSKDGESQINKEKEKARKKLEHHIFQGVVMGLATVYAVVALLSKSNFIWSCSMIVLGRFLGGLTGYM